jgi:hypothetical protein
LFCFLNTWQVFGRAKKIRIPHPENRNQSDLSQADHADVAFSALNATLD